MTVFLFLYIFHQTYYEEANPLYLVDGKRKKNHHNDNFFVTAQFSYPKKNNLILVTKLQLINSSRIEYLRNT